MNYEDQKFPPLAGDFCYGKSHQNHLRRTAAAARFPARLARQAPRRTRAIRGPRTNGACSPVGLRCSAAFKARVSQSAVFLPADALRSYAEQLVRETPGSDLQSCAIKQAEQRICATPALIQSDAKIKSFRLRRVTFVTAKVTKTMCAGRLPLRGSLRVSPDRRRAELGPSMALEQSALVRLSGCDARQPSRRGKSKPVCCNWLMRCNEPHRTALFAPRDVAISNAVKHKAYASMPRRLLLPLRLKSTPSGAAWRGAKVRMFERMDARVRTGPRHASRAGDRRVALTCVRREWFCRLLP